MLPPPYRHNAAPSPEPRPTDIPFYWMFVLLGLLPVANALLGHGSWGAEPTVGLIILWTAGRALLRHYRSAWGRH